MLQKAIQALLAVGSIGGLVYLSSHQSSLRQNPSAPTKAEIDAQILAGKKTLASLSTHFGISETQMQAALTTHGIVLAPARSMRAKSAAEKYYEYIEQIQQDDDKEDEEEGNTGFEPMSTRIKDKKEKDRQHQQQQGNGKESLRIRSTMQSLRKYASK